MTTDVLVDSDAFIALFVETDANYGRATQTVERLQQEQSRLVATNVVIAETASMLSRRVTQKAAREFLTYVEDTDFPLLYVDAALHKRAVTVFREQLTKNVSLFDCLNVAAVEQYHLAGIFSFDRFYTKYNIPMVAWQKTPAGYYFNSFCAKSLMVALKLPSSPWTLRQRIQKSMMLPP